MKKSLVIPLIILAAFGIASPYIIGLVVENKFTTQLETLAADNESDLLISDIHYNRGYVNSAASFVMTFIDSTDESSNISILIESNMQHLPVHMSEFGLSLFQIYSKNRFSFSAGPEKLITFINENTDGNIISGYSRFNALGDFEAVFNVPAINFSSETDDFNIQMEPTVINISGQIDGSETLSYLSLPSANIVSTDFSLKLNNISSMGDLRTDISGIELGNIVTQVANLSVESAMGNADIKNMTLSSVTDLVNDKVDTGFSFKIESIESPLPISSVSYMVDVNALSINSAKILQDPGQQIDNTEITPELMDDYLNQFLIETFKPGLQVNQKLNANAFGGKLSVDLDVEYTGIEGVEIAALAEPKVAIKSVLATAVITADNSALLRSPLGPMIDGFLEQGLIKRDNNNVISVANLTSGKLTVNELDIPIEPLMDVLLLKMTESKKQEQVDAN